MTDGGQKPSTENYRHCLKISVLLQRRFLLRALSGLKCSSLFKLSVFENRLQQLHSCFVRVSVSAGIAP
jgi:hypothetical protein